MMKRIVAILGLGIVGFGISGCSHKDISVPKTEIIAVYMHEVDSYSVARDTGKNSILIEKLRSRTPTVIFSDVKPGESMWYICRGTYEGFFGSYSVDAGCEIHVRDINDINTAGWNHGKFGSGKTERIQ